MPRFPKILTALCVLAVAIGCQSGPVPVETGVCHLLKPDSICRTIGANLNVVFLPVVPGKSSAVVEDEIESQVSQFINFFSALPLRSSCLAPLLELLCRTAYPDCEIVPGGPVFSSTTLPVLLDKTACTQVAASCATTFQALAQQSIDLYTCEDTFPNNTLGTFYLLCLIEFALVSMLMASDVCLVPGYSDYYFDKLEGKDVFPSGSATYIINTSDAFTTSENFAFVVETALPSKFNISEQCENLQCVEDQFYRAVDCNCVFAPSCPFPAYPLDVYEISWIIVVVLGMCSVPFNVTIVAHWKRFQQVPFIPVAAVVGLLYVVVDTLPVVIIKYGFSCRTEGANALISLLSFENFEEEWYCTVNKGSVHLLQMLINAAVLGIASIYDAVKAAKEGKRVRPSSRRMTRNAFIVLYVFAIPLACLIATFTIGSDSTSFRAANELRYAFSCGPRYSEIWQEALFVQVPIVFSGVALFVICAQVAMLSYSINIGSSARKHSRFNSKVQVSKEDKKKLRRAKLTVAQRIARRVIIFGSAAAVFSVVYSLVTFVILASLTNFDQALDDFVVCNVGIDFATCSGGDLLTILNETCNSELTVCGNNPSSEVPESALFALNWILPAIIPLLFGIMFGINHVRQDLYNAYIWTTTCGYEEEVFRNFVSDDYLFYNGESRQYSSGVSSVKPPPGLVKPPPGLNTTPPPPGLGPPGLTAPRGRLQSEEEIEESVYETVNPDF